MKKLASLFFIAIAISCTSVDLGSIPLTEGEIPFKLPPGIYTDVDGDRHQVDEERWSISEEDLFKEAVEEEDNNLWLYLLSTLAAGLGTGILVGKRKTT